MELKVQSPETKESVLPSRLDSDKLEWRRSLGLIDLPAEVRVDIYRHLFQNSILSVEPVYPALSHCGFSICPCQFPYALLDTCRTIRREATGYLLASTTLTLAGTSQKLDILPRAYLSAIPRAIVLNVGQYLRKGPLDFGRFTALVTLELHNIVVWCRYHEAADLHGGDGEAIMVSLAMFNIKRHGPNLAALCASKERRFNILLFCRFVISSNRQETLDAVLDIDSLKIIQRSTGAAIKDRNAWAGFY